MADDRVGAALACTDRGERVDIARTQREHITFLRLVAPDLERRHAGFGIGYGAQRYLATPTAVVQDLRNGIGQTAGADVVDHENGIAFAGRPAGIDDHLRTAFDLGVVALYRGEVEFRINEPHRSADYSFAGRRVKIDCRFEAFHPVYPFSAHPEGCPRYYSDDRTEQHGWITGTMEIDGDRFEFRSLGQRDHAWGARIWGVNQHYKWFHATTEAAAIHFFEMQSFGTRHIRGFVFKEEAMGQVTGVECKYLFDEGMHHRQVAARLTDDLGRTTEVQAEVYAKYRFEVDPKVVLNEGGITVTIEGLEGTGWCEFCWNRDYFEFARNHVAAYPPFKDLCFAD